VFELGGLAPKDLARLLNSLTDQLVLEGKVDAVRRTESPADSAAAAPPAGSPDVGLWLRLLEGTRRSIIGFGCALKLQIDAGAFKAELRSCTGP